jgi:hypothetical protein
LKTAEKNGLNAAIRRLGGMPSSGVFGEIWQKTFALAILMKFLPVRGDLSIGVFLESISQGAQGKKRTRRNIQLCVLRVLRAALVGLKPSRLRSFFAPSMGVGNFVRIFVAYDSLKAVYHYCFLLP